jgi:hypothetical protein
MPEPFDDLNRYVDSLFGSEEDEAEQERESLALMEEEDEDDPLVSGPRLPMPRYQPPIYYGQPRGPQPMMGVMQQAQGAPTSIPQLGPDRTEHSLSDRLGGAAKAIGKGTWQFTKDFARDLNVFEGDIGTRERLYRIANVGAFFLPPVKVGQTAALATRMAVRGLEAGAVTGGLAALRGDPVVPSAGMGAGIGAGIEGVLGKYRLSKVLSKAKLAARDFNSQILFDKAQTPLRNQEWAVLSASLTDPRNVVLRPEVNAQRSQKLLADLKRLGYDPVPAKGFGAEQGEGMFEDVFLVPGMTRRHALELANTYEQRGLLTNEGYFDLDMATLSPIKFGETKFNQDVTPDLARTVLPGGQFAFGFDGPVQIGRAKLKPNLSTAEAKMESLIDRKEESLVDKALALPSNFTFDKWYTRVVRSFHGVEEMEKFLGTGVQKEGAERLLPSNLAQLSAAWSSFAQHAWDYGIVDWTDRTRTVAPALSKIFGRLKAGEHDAFERYGFARRLKHLSSGPDAAVPGREFTLPSLPDGTRLTLEDLDEIIANAERDTPQFASIFDDVVNWRNTYLRETLVKSGVITEEAYQAITSTSMEYIPLKKTWEKVLDRARINAFPNAKVISDPIKTIKGLQGKYKPWMESLVEDMYSFSKLSHQQDFFKAFIDELEINDPTAASLFAQRIPVPATELSQVQREALEMLADSDPELARAAAVTGEEALSLIAPQRLRQRGLIGALRPVLEKRVVRDGEDLGDIEILKGAALKWGDEIYTGKAHMNAMSMGIKDRAVKGLPTFGPEIEGTYDFGFITNKGRFVSFTEADEIASKYASKDFLEWRSGTYGMDNPRGIGSEDLPRLNQGITEEEHEVMKRVWYKVTDENIWEAVNSMNPAEMGMLTKIGASFASLLRAGATLAFEFMARNPIKDTVYSAITTGAPPITTFIKGFSHAFKQDEVFQKWLAAGGGRATMVAMDRETISQAVQQASGIYATTARGKIWNVVKSPVEALQVLSDFMESGTRVGVYERKFKELVANGIPAERATRLAALASRDASVDFSVHGSRTQALRMTVAFWNAMIQGYDNLRRSFVADPFGAGMRAMAMITVPSTMLYLLNRDDPEYFDLPSWERDMFWHVKFPNALPWVGDKWLRIPKPFDLGVVFGSSVERYLQFVDQQDPKALDAMMGNWLSKSFMDMMPIPTVARPLIENATNRSFLRNRPVESRALADVDEQYRIQPGTSEVAIKLGDWLGYSPVKIDNLLGGYTGGLGRLGADILDAGIAAAEGRPPIPQRMGGFDPRDIPGLRGLFSQYPRHSDSVDRFYEIADEVRKAEQTRSYLQRTMRFDDLADWLEHKALHLGAADTFREFQEQLKFLRQQRDLILRDKTITSAERGRQLDMLSEAMNTLAASTLPMQKVLEEER